MATWGNWSIDDVNANFKTKFENRSKAFYSTQDPIEGRLKKDFNFTGKKKEIETILSFAGGYGARKLPMANSSLMAIQEVTAKKVYFRAQVDREGMMAASNDEGSFEQYLQFPMKETVKSYVNQCGRITFGDSTGVLGRGAGATNVTGAGTVGSPYVVTLRANGFKANNLDRKSVV